MDQQSLPPTSNTDILPASTLATVSLVSAILGVTLP